jgi:hypothetical protein
MGPSLEQDTLIRDVSKESLFSSDGEDELVDSVNAVFDMKGVAEKRKAEYIEECKRMGCTPVSQFFDAIDSTTISLRHHGLRTKGFHSMVKFLLANDNLQELDLAENNIDDKGGADLCNLLSKHSSLTSLDFSQNQIGGNPFSQNISQALAANSSLKKVNKKAK